MRFTVAAVGKPRNAALAAAILEYETRAARYWPLAFVDVKEEPVRGRTPDEARRRDAERLRAAVPKGSAIWLCDRDGKALSSEEFARWMQRSRESARDTTLLIGGAFGLHESLRDGADGILALGPMTFPHELARLVLAEQLYRAGTIVRGEPYHK
jgi:23S rRNA (pseudouridine1915-N3)-methyltransferase